MDIVFMFSFRFLQIGDTLMSECLDSCSPNTEQCSEAKISVPLGGWVQSLDATGLLLGCQLSMAVTTYRYHRTR